MIGLIFSGATAGFLIMNFPPAKIFMGDVGSYPAGFFIASLGLIDRRLFVPVALVLGVFLFDTVVTLLRRIVTGEKWYEAHRSHFYQRAVKAGYSHLQITAILSAITVFLSALAYIYMHVSILLKAFILLAALSILIILALWTISREKKVGVAGL